MAMVLLRDATTKGPSSKQAELFLPWLFGSALCSTFNSGLLVTQQVVIVLDMQQDENTNMLASKLSTDLGWVLLKVGARVVVEQSYSVILMFSSCSVPVLVCRRGSEACKMLWRFPENNLHYNSYIYIYIVIVLKTHWKLKRKLFCNSSAPNSYSPERRHTCFHVEVTGCKMELVAPLENSLGDSFPRGTSGMIQDEISTSDATDSM